MKKISIRFFGMDISWADVKHVCLVLISVLSFVATVIGFIAILIGIFHLSFNTIVWGLFGFIFGGLLIVHFGEKLLRPWRGARP